VVCLSSAAGLRGQTAAVPWSSYAHGPQHTALSTIGAQRLERVKWSTPVDLVLQNTAGPLYIHYGSPLITAANTVLLPERITSSNTFQVEAFSGANGSLLYTLSTAYTPPPYLWIPVFGPTLSQGTRLYYPGPGGTVYYRNQPDSATGPSGQIAFYGNAAYAANQPAFNSSVMISTPITADASGNIYFGFDVVGSNPENLTSGLARIGADGTGSWIGASTAAGGDTTIVEVALNCAPAVSNDGSLLYFAVSEGPVGQGYSGGYLVAVDSANLSSIARVRLIDPETNVDAEAPDLSSASPTVGPDGDVYFGVLESSETNNDDRGWLLHFDKNLTTTKTPGAFGWDTTASVVPASLVASYTGTSSYLLFTKYNNYLGLGPGGNGQNKIAVLDPNSQMTDPITGVRVMQEVITILGPTPYPPGNTNGSVREWCINSGAIDPFTASVLANSEDGTIYRWSLTGNSFTQKLALTNGVGEAYTPTAIGADGTVYAISDANLFAIGQASNMTIVSSHIGNFAPEQGGAVYALTATNSGSAATEGSVTVTDILPPSLIAASIDGQGWSCTQPAGPCTRSDSLAAGASYPTLTLTVNVASSGPSPVTNIAEVSSDGAANSVNSVSNDVTAIVGTAPSLSITKSHTGSFTQGQVGTYSVTVSNVLGAGPTNGTVTVTETVPNGLALYSMAGTGWICPSGGVSCTRTDSLAAGTSYPSIAITVSVANNAPVSVINQVNVSVGGWTSYNASDATAIVSPCALTQDGRAGLADVQNVIDEALGVTQAVDDLNQDGVVNAADVQIVINAALGLGCSI
jgi:uncharacterized repeat protein (TIGR01451 family)